MNCRSMNCRSMHVILCLYFSKHTPCHNIYPLITGAFSVVSCSCFLCLVKTTWHGFFCSNHRSRLMYDRLSWGCFPEHPRAPGVSLQHPHVWVNAMWCGGANKWYKCTSNCCWSKDTHQSHLSSTSYARPGNSTGILIRRAHSKPCQLTILSQSILPMSTLCTRYVLNI